MGRPARFQYEDISQVCVDLDRRGILTADNILTELGGGSKTTILRHYNRWLDERRATAAQPLEETLSERFRTALVLELQGVAAHAQEEANVRIASLEEQLEAALDSLQKAEAQAAEDAQAAEVLREAQATAKREFDAAYAEKDWRLAEAQKQVDAISKKLSQREEETNCISLEAARALHQVEVTQHHSKRLEADNGKLIDEQRRLHDVKSAHEQRAAVAEAVNKKLEEQLARAQQESGTASDKLSVLQAESAATQRTLHDTEAKLTSARSQSQDLEHRLANAIRELGGAQARLQELERRVKTANALRISAAAASRRALDTGHASGNVEPV